MLYGSLDKFSFRPYFYPNGKVLFKLTVWAKDKQHLEKTGGEYLIVTGEDGCHYEQFVDLDKPEEVVAAIRLAAQGRLGGHCPYQATPMRKHSGKPFPKVFVKGRGEKGFVWAGGGKYDRVIDIEPVSGLSVGVSYLVPHQEVSEI
jgi:hypothetical protein